MAQDKSKETDVLITALKESMVNGEAPLYRTGKQPGLLPSRNGVCAEAGEAAVRDGLLEITRTEERGDRPLPWVKITPRGVQYVYQNESPAAVLQELSQLLASENNTEPKWIAEAVHTLRELTVRIHELLDKHVNEMEFLGKRVASALRRIGKVGDQPTLSLWHLDTLNYLDQRETVAEGSECPLPELFKHLREAHPQLSLTSYHDGLRRLHAQRIVELVAHQGPITELTEPECALVEGPVVYATVRRFVQ